jgi:hypothetical protein
MRIVVAAVLVAAADAMLVAHHLLKLAAHLVTARPFEDIVYVWLQSRSPLARGRVVLKFIVVYVYLMRETSLLLRLWANTSLEAYLRTHRHGGSCGSQRIRTHIFLGLGVH